MKFCIETWTVLRTNEPGQLLFLSLRANRFLSFGWRRAFIEGAREARGPKGGPSGLREGHFGPFGAKGALRAPSACLVTTPRNREEWEGKQVLGLGFEVLGSRGLQKRGWAAETKKCLK